MSSIETKAVEDVLIRPIQESDIALATQLINRAYRGEASRKGWTTEADLMDGLRTDEVGLREVLNNPKATMLVRLEAGEVTGTVYVEDKGDRLYVGMLTVEPDRQAKGIGRTLVRAAEVYAMERGLGKIEMWVFAQRTELIAWYERQGYGWTGQLLPFVYTEDRFGKPKTELMFKVLEKDLNGTAA
jgi:ribosomal protein S18 acetylase RimI-like enzyme